MKDSVKIALIAAIAMVASVAIYQYFSPYQSCVRNLMSGGFDEPVAAFECAKRLGGNSR